MSTTTTTTTTANPCHYSSLHCDESEKENANATSNIERREVLKGDDDDDDNENNNNYLVKYLKIDALLRTNVSLNNSNNQQHRVLVEKVNPPTIKSSANTFKSTSLLDKFKFSSSSPSPSSWSPFQQQQQQSHPHSQSQIQKSTGTLGSGFKLASSNDIFRQVNSCYFKNNLWRAIVTSSISVKHNNKNNNSSLRGTSAELMMMRSLHTPSSSSPSSSTNPNDMSNKFFHNQSNTHAASFLLAPSHRHKRPQQQQQQQQPQQQNINQLKTKHRSDLNRIMLKSRSRS